MAGKCSCGKGEAKPGASVSFQHRGLTLCVSLGPYDCEDCAKSRAIQWFEKYGAISLNIEEDNSFTVNWQSTGNEDQIRLLIALGVLAYQASGNWYVAGDGSISLNPMLSSPLYFTRREDALSYAQVKIGKTSYDWKICHIGEVISKETVLAMEVK